MPSGHTKLTQRRMIVLVVALLLTFAGAIASAMAGQLPASWTEVIGTVLHSAGFNTGWRPNDELIEQTLLQIRFPRVAMSLLVGAALAIAGAVMQSIFGNPLAEPGVVGVSSGAALGAALAIAIGMTTFGGWSIAVMAFLGGFLSTVLVYATARSQGRTEVVTLLLTGIAINAFAGAGLALMMFSGGAAAREQIVFWQLGSINGSRWSEVFIVLVLTVPAMVWVSLMARQYDVLALGERSAAHLGLNVERLRVISIVLVALLTAAGVAFVGIIAFVGLVVPHVIRMLLGPGHRWLLPLSALMGALLLVWADLFARTILDGSDLPIGMLTSLIGGPFFFYLVRSARSRAGGWA
ncbi:MAG: iron ABC transporter permease [Actinomycetales bacterium]|nr:iron ABC transporter permease [Actinomycetales bacterium]